MSSEIILSNLIVNPEYTKRVLPFIQEEYFESKEEQIVFRHIKSYTEKYGANLSYDIIFVEISNDLTLAENSYKNIDTLVGKLKTNEKVANIDWLIAKSEEFCKTRALHNAIFKAVSIFEGEDKKLTREAIPEILSEALGVSFDASVGHDYVDDAESRFEYYHSKEEKVSLGLDSLDEITKGGVNKKTLNLIASGPHGGKTALMCHSAAKNLEKGNNVLYITLEMSEKEISKRIDANLFDVNMDNLMTMSKSMFTSNINVIKNKTKGKLKVKEYPTSSAHVGHFKTLLNELLLKQNFVPYIVYVDYMNIMASSRIKAGAGANSYSYIKAIGEELRGLAGQFSFPIVSATQMNRGASGNGDAGMEGIAESFSTAMTADFIILTYSPEDLIKQDQIMFIQLKNRYNDLNKKKKFLCGFDRAKMKFYDIVNNTSFDETPVMDLIQKNKTTEKKFEKFKFGT